MPELTNDSQAASEPQVRSSALLEAEGWVAEWDGSWTEIRDEDGNRVTRYCRSISLEELKAFKVGYNVGVHRGKDAGRIEKAFEVRRALGL